MSNIPNKKIAMKKFDNFEHEIDTLAPRLEQNYMNAKATKLFIHHLQFHEKLVEINANEIKDLNDNISGIEQSLKDIDKQIIEYTEELRELQEAERIKTEEYEIEQRENQMLINELKSFGPEDEIQTRAGSIKTFLDAFLKEGEVIEEILRRENFITELKEEIEELTTENTKNAEELKTLRENQNKICETNPTMGFTKSIVWTQMLLSYFKNTWNIEIVGVQKIEGGFILHIAFNKSSCKLIFKNGKFEDVEFKNNGKNCSLNLLLRICKEINIPELLLYCISATSFHKETEEKEDL